MPFILANPNPILCNLTKLRYSEETFHSVEIRTPVNNLNPNDYFNHVVINISDGNDGFPIVVRRTSASSFRFVFLGDLAENPEVGRGVFNYSMPKYETQNIAVEPMHHEMDLSPFNEIRITGFMSAQLKYRVAIFCSKVSYESPYAYALRHRLSEKDVVFNGKYVERNLYNDG